MSASCAYSDWPFEVNIEDVSDYVLGRGKQRDMHDKYLKFRFIRYFDKRYETFILID